MITFIHKKLINASEAEKNKALNGFLERREHLNVWSDDSFFEFIEYIIEKHNLNTELLIRHFSKVNGFEHCSAWKKL